MPRGVSLYDEAALQRRLLTFDSYFGGSLVLWWDPRTGLSMNGTTVASWTDRVGGLVASQSNSSNQPGLIGRNGAQRLSFNGSQRLTFNSQTLPQGTKVATLCTSAYGNQSGSGAPFVIGMGNSTGGVRAVYQISNGDLSASSGGYDIDGGFSYVGKDRFTVLTVDTATTSVRVDGNAAGSKSISPASDTNYNSAGIGLWPTYGASWVGDVGHVLMFNKVLNPRECEIVEGIESWLDGKFGLNLPVSHRFYGRPPVVGD